jgi:two-component system, NarL family, sensor kinase
MYNARCGTPPGTMYNGLKARQPSSTSLKLSPLYIVHCTLYILSFLPLSAQPNDSLAIEALKQEISGLEKNPTRQWPGLPRLAWAYKELGDRYNRRFGYNKYTLDAYYDALNTFSKVGDSTEYYRMHTYIADYYGHDRYMAADARSYYQKALGYYQRQGDPVGHLICRVGLVGTLLVGPYDEAQTTELQRIITLSRQYKQPYYECYAFNLLANSALQRHRWFDARRYAQASLALAQQHSVGWLTRLGYFYLGLERQYQNDPQQSLAYLQQALAANRTTANGTEERDIFRHMAEVYEKLGNHAEAYRYARLVIDLNNTFFDSEQTRNIRLQELNLKVRGLEVEKGLVEQQRQHQELINSLLIVGLILAVLAVVVLVVLKRQQTLIGQQKDIISRQRIRELELQSLHALIDGQEKERTRIARDLHDGLGAQLSRIKLFTESHSQQLEPRLHQPLNQFIDDACHEIRLIANNLHPHTLASFGLATALEDLTNKLRLVNETEVHFSHYGNVPELDNDQAVMIYRVVQELLSNAIKHAQAQSITVQLMANDESLLISVDDNGCGYCPEQAREGNGLPNIRSRIGYLGGQAIWHSEPGKGTSVMISLPK